MVPRITDPLAADAAKGLAGVVEYLAAIDEDGAWYDEQELDDIAALVGDRPESLATGRAVVASRGTVRRSVRLATTSCICGVVPPGTTS